MLTLFDDVSYSNRTQDAKFFNGSLDWGRRTNLKVASRIPFDSDFRVDGVALTLLDPWKVCDTTDAALRIWNGFEEAWIKVGARYPAAPAYEDLLKGEVPKETIGLMNPLVLKKDFDFGAAFGHLSWRQPKVSAAFLLVLVGDKA